jgi:hypothetical protein
MSEQLKAGKVSATSTPGDGSKYVSAQGKILRESLGKWKLSRLSA